MAKKHDDKVKYSTANSTLKMSVNQNFCPAAAAFQRPNNLEFSEFDKDATFPFAPVPNSVSIHYYSFFNIIFVFKKYISVFLIWGLKENRFVIFISFSRTFRYFSSYYKYTGGLFVLYSLLESFKVWKSSSNWAMYL